MKNLLFFCIFPLIFIGCFRSPDFGIIQALSARKQKMKISNLEKKLERAEEIELLAKADVENLRQEIDEEKLALIRKQIDAYEKVNISASVLFVEEREALYELIQEGPSPAAFKAQVELDRILRIITEHGNEEKSHAF